MSKEVAVQELIEFLRFPSVSTDPAHNKDVKACADWLVNKLNQIGLKAKAYPTEGHPIVVAKNAFKDGLPTVMIYGHYDVQPADPFELWNTPPFEPVVKDDVLYGRGSTDNKGQIMAHIQGVEAALKKNNGELPVNLIFLIEGEEEVGSDNLEKFLHTHRDELHCDIIVVSDTEMVGPNQPTFTYGLRGIAAVEVTVRGPSADLHSGVFGGSVANPAMALARLLATIHDENGHVAIEGFYDDVRPLEDWERESWKNTPFTDKELLELTGSPCVFGEKGFTSIERTGARPTAEINGMGSGYQGEGSKTIIPSKAFAKLTFRLVADQDPKKIAEVVVRHLKKHCPPGVELELQVGHSGPPYVTDPHSKAAEAAKIALKKTFQTEPVMLREGGSIPIVQNFKAILGVETLLLGLALPDCKIHSPNENFRLENYRTGILLNQNLLEELGRMLSK